MIIGSCTIHLHIATAQSLKEKRQVLRSLIARIRNEFNVSVAEVDDQNRWQSAILGVAVVATDQVHAQRQLESVVSFIERQRPDCPLLRYEIELL